MPPNCMASRFLPSFSRDLGFLFFLQLSLVHAPLSKDVRDDIFISHHITVANRTSSPAVEFICSRCYGQSIHCTASETAIKVGLFMIFSQESMGPDLDGKLWHGIKARDPLENAFLQCSFISFLSCGFLLTKNLKTTGLKS